MEMCIFSLNCAILSALKDLKLMVPEFETEISGFHSFDSIVQVFLYDHYLLTNITEKPKKVLNLTIVFTRNRHYHNLD